MALFLRVTQDREAWETWTGCLTRVLPRTGKKKIIRELEGIVDFFYLFFISSHLWLRSRRSTCYHPLSAFWTEWPDAARSVSEPFPSPIESSSRTVFCQRLWIKSPVFPPIHSVHLGRYKWKTIPCEMKLWWAEGNRAATVLRGRDWAAEYGRLEELTGSGNWDEVQWDNKIA